MTIRFEHDVDSPGLFQVIAIGEHVKIIKNPVLCATQPYWVQAYMANAALRAITPLPPRHLRQQVAKVIHIELLREIREARVAADAAVSSDAVYVKHDRLYGQDRSD